MLAHTPAKAGSFLERFGAFDSPSESVAWEEFERWREQVSWAPTEKGPLLYSGTLARPTFSSLVFKTKAIPAFDGIPEFQLAWEAKTIRDAIAATLYIDFWASIPNNPAPDSLPQPLDIARCKGCLKPFHVTRRGKTYCSNLCASKSGHRNARARRANGKA